MPGEDDYIKSLRKDFFEEAFDMIDRMEASILELENNQEDKDSINEIFRAVHTLKGSAGAVELSEVASYSHRFEDLLDCVREDQITVDDEMVDILLEGIDILKELINLSHAEEEITRDLDSDLQKLAEFKEARLSGGGKAEKKKAPAKKKAKAEIKEEAEEEEESVVEINKELVEDKQDEAEKQEIALDEDKKQEVREGIDDGAKAYFVHVNFLSDSPMKTVGGVQVYVALKEIGSVVTSNPALEDLETDNFYPNVTYLCLTDKAPKEIEESVAMDDVTNSIEVEAFDTSKLELSSRSSDTEEKKKEDKSKSEKSQADTKVSQRQSSFLRVESEKIDDMLNQVGELVINKGAYQQYDEGFSDFIEELNGEIGTMKNFVKENIVSILKKAEKPIPKKEAKVIKNNIMDELTVIFKQMNKSVASLRDMVDKYRSSYQMLTRTTNELQETVMNIRMVPIAQIFNRFPRLVRDLSRELDKDMELEITGEETELDKTVIEVLVDPLVHLVRNSIDHGIENREDREAAGKPPVGKIRLSAAHEGNLIIIKIIDDGKGINTEKVLSKAIASGVVDEDAKLSQKEILDLIFEPGLSTADKISSISGRGVGMDVVKRSIERISGSISVESEAGVGTMLSLRIPLTLAIIQALIVESEGEWYSIPLNSITETMRLEEGDVFMLEGVPVVQVREEVITVVFLKEIFNLPPKGEKRSAMYGVNITFEEKQVVVVVDGLIGEQDIVIKSLKDKFSNTKGVAGATTLGDGTISFIIDVQALVDLGAERILETRALKGWGPGAKKTTISDELSKPLKTEGGNMPVISDEEAARKAAGAIKDAFGGKLNK